jgi:hypothetical protein
MSNQDYSFTVTGSGTGTLTISVITSDGQILQVQEGAANFDKLYRALADKAPEVEIVELSRPVLQVGATLRRLSDRFSFDGTNITFDGDIISNNMSRQLIALLSDSASANAAQSFVAFMEKLYSNPSKQSRDSLYDFITRYDISILPDGDFIAYKGVNRNGTSRNAGYGIVDGVVFEHAHLQNNVGSVVEIPRSRVDTDNAIGCSTGLHAGSYRYASNFARGLLLAVKINPRDVVSVPEDCSYAKIRVSRYVVLSTTEVALTETYVAFNADNDWSRDDYDDDDDEGFDDNWPFDYDVDNGEDLDDDEDEEESEETTQTNVKVVTDDLDTTIRDTISIVYNADADSNFIKFSYPDRVNGGRKDVTGFNIENVAEKANFAGRLYDATFTGVNLEGNYRSYLFSKMENIEVDTLPVPHILDADIVTPFKMD